MCEQESIWVLRLPVVMPEDVEESMERILDYICSETGLEDSSELVNDVLNLDSWLDGVRNLKIRATQRQLTWVGLVLAAVFFLPELAAVSRMLVGGDG